MAPRANAHGCVSGVHGVANRFAACSRGAATTKNMPDLVKKQPVCGMAEHGYPAGDYQTKDNSVPLDLYDILSLDEERQIVRVEPRVSMAQLSDFLIPRGWTVPVVAELDELTVGGLISGYGMETSAHKYGFFADAVEAVEMVTGDGEVVRASREENADLFANVPWSYGALGFLVAVELRVIPCLPYVRLQYYPFRSRAALSERLREESSMEHPSDFLEAILYNSEEGVLILGDFTSYEQAFASGCINDISWWFKPWYYTHVESMLRRPGLNDENPYEEYMPVRTYYHRHSRSIFWEGELILPFGNHWLFRLLFGWLFPLHVGLLKLTEGRTLKEYYAERHVCQDAVVPMDKLEDGIDFFHQNWECYPLWLCPDRIFKTEPEGLVRPRDSHKLRPGESQMYVDIGAWYIPGPVQRGEPFSGAQARKNFEQWLIENDGYQCLYAITEMTRSQYRSMFHTDNYNRVRKKFGAVGVFMDTYDKVKRR